MAISKVKTGSITDSAITSAKISNGTIVDADISPSAAISSGKLTVCTASLENDIQKNAFNISLLGFKMAVNDGLTIFNLVDGVVDEFNDESGTDESEGSNDNYVAACDYYINGSPFCLSAGFTTTSITEPDTSTAGTNPGYGAGTLGTYTVGCGITTITAHIWGAGGGSGPNCSTPSKGGGGGYSTGNISVSSGQVLDVLVGEGGCRSQLSAPQLSFGGGGASLMPTSNYVGAGGGASGVFNTSVAELVDSDFAPGGTGTPLIPAIFTMAGGGGGGGNGQKGGAGGGLLGDVGGPLQLEQTNAGPTTPDDASAGAGGGGDQEQGGQAGTSPTSTAQTGGFLYGGNSGTQPALRSGGGGGFYGGGGSVDAGGPHGAGGGGSSYIGNPAISSGSTEEGAQCEGGGDALPNYQPNTNIGGLSGPGTDGYVLITASGISSCAVSTTLVSTAFTATSVPTTSRIVVFEENVDTPTLNTDIIASISRDGGTTYTNATLSDSGYVTGSSGQRILTGQATISGQPSGQSMRWKLALVNNTVKIHGVSLQWS